MNEKIQLFIDKFINKIYHTNLKVSYNKETKYYEISSDNKTDQLLCVKNISERNLFCYLDGLYKGGLFLTK